MSGVSEMPNGSDAARVADQVLLQAARDAHAPGSTEWLVHKLAAKAEKEGRRQAKTIARELRMAATQKAKARKEELKVKLEKGTEVLNAGLRAWSNDEVLGLLLEGRDRATQSPTLRVAMRKRGAAFRSSPPPSFAQNTLPPPPPLIH